MQVYSGYEELVDPNPSDHSASCLNLLINLPSLV